MPGRVQRRSSVRPVAPVPVKLAPYWPPRVFGSGPMPAAAPPPAVVRVLGFVVRASCFGSTAPTISRAARAIWATLRARSSAGLLLDVALAATFADAAVREPARLSLDWALRTGPRVAVRALGAVGGPVNGTPRRDVSQGETPRCCGRPRPPSTTC